RANSGQSTIGNRQSAMIYYLLYELLFTHFKDKDWYLVKALNVFQYVTFRTAYATITALLISLIFGGKLIEWLRRLNVGQQIREEGPQGHMVKRGTPTMGGVLIVGSVLISTLLWARLSSVYVWTAMLATLFFGLIGFVDDYWKIAKRRSLGLTGRQKLLAQLLVAVMVWAVLYLSTRFWGGNDYSWNFSIPFIKATARPYGPSFIGPYLYLVLIAVVLLGSSNAVNLTDGLDGLAISVTVIAMGALTGFTYLSSDARWAGYLELTHRPEAAELTVFCGAMVGASLGFLWYNAPPAQVFMGDVGSLAIGGAMGTVAVLTKQEFMLLMVGGVFVIEAVSVMLQVSVFKMTKRTTGTGRRLFKMTPLHHHFEMQDWKESKIVFRFLILAILFALLSLSTLKLR
ncbi:MAG TPA: phospho-N-acetylmuramoyl-pentapeptide-transferase, partial [Pyrinomonadaceae bacterium]|nr:phospho-N-acetylmuramoyl-pentapeptide-transferase [Pyrinomonadaceae bacterium]